MPPPNETRAETKDVSFTDAEMDRSSTSLGAPDPHLTEHQRRILSRGSGTKTRFPTLPGMQEGMQTRGIGAFPNRAVGPPRRGAP